jgi:aminopeptidase
MIDPRMKKLADVLVNYSVKVKPGELTVVTGEVSALPLLREVYIKVLQAGGNPVPLLLDDEITESNRLYSSDEQIKWVSPLETLLYVDADVFISVRSTINTRALTNIDPAKEQKRIAARREIREAYFNRSASGELRWVLTQYPTPAYAQEADMSLREFEDFVFRTTYCDLDNPVEEWQKVHDRQEELINWLKDKKTVEVRSPNAELSLSIEGRTFMNADGTINMPSGEIYTGPVENSCNGWVKFTYPAVREGREVEGVYLEFKDGKVIKASAEKNEEFLLSQLDVDKGARYLGEFAIGTNYGIDRFTKNILFDEKIGGSFHIAVGAGYPQTGSVNKSVIHWDFICDIRKDSEIKVDGELLYKDGQFMI